MMRLVIPFILLSCLAAQAQALTPDTIYLAGSRSILGNVLEVSDSAVRYRSRLMPAGTFSEVSLNQLVRVAFAGHSKPSILGWVKPDSTLAQKRKLKEEAITDSVFVKQTPVPEPMPRMFALPYVPSSNQLYEMGRDDATKNYKEYRTATYWTAVATVIGLLPGTVVWASTSNTRPKDKTLAIPPGPFQAQPDYLKGYRDEAYEMKRHKVRRTFQNTFLISFSLGLVAGYLIRYR